MITCYDIIKALMRTEKGTSLERHQKYLFQVAFKSTKIEIKRAIEEIYKVRVQNVNTSIMPGKRKRVRQEFGHTSDWKKAIVTLKEGHKIEIT